MAINELSNFLKLRLVFASSYANTDVNFPFLEYHLKIYSVRIQQPLSQVYAVAYEPLRGRLHEPGLSSNLGQLTIRGFSFFLFEPGLVVIWYMVFPTRVSCAQPGSTRGILIDAVNMSFFRPRQFLSFVWQFDHKFNRHTFAYARRQRNHVRNEVDVFIIHLRFAVFETDNQVFYFWARSQTSRRFFFVNARTCHASSRRIT